MTQKCEQCDIPKEKAEFRYKYTNRRGEDIFRTVCIECERKLKKKLKHESKISIVN